MECVFPSLCQMKQVNRKHIPIESEMSIGIYSIISWVNW